MWSILIKYALSGAFFVIKLHIIFSSVVLFSCVAQGGKTVMYTLKQLIDKSL